MDITFDNGNKWERLKAPKFDYQGRQINCTKNCYINLFGESARYGISGENYGSFLSVPEAVGLVIGTGNVGQFLSTDPDSTYTYITRDGGLSWFEIFKGSTVYDYGDHGGILLLAQSSVPTTTIWYSLDMGITWTPNQFSNSPAIIINIFSISATKSKFILYGYLNNVITYWGIDFTNIYSRKCLDKDFEKWNHNVNQDGKCVLGHNITYKRRKTDADCASGEYFDHVESIKNCNCTLDDYECDLGFERTELSWLCVRVKKQIANCIAGKRIESQGYRKIPGDTCINDLPELMPNISLCDIDLRINDPPSVLTILIVIAMSIGLIIFLYLGMIIGNRSGFVRKYCPLIKKAPKWVQINIPNTLEGDEDSGVDIFDKNGKDSEENSDVFD